MSNAPYNPLDVKNLGASVAEALLEKDPEPLGGLAPFQGAGIYAIYYTGDFPLYRPIAEANRQNQWRWPIYVGKAVPQGARKALTGTSKGRPLFNRLSEHAESISNAVNLDLADFYCRHLVVEDIWIPLGESLLIAMFAPVWNRMLDGFGNHDPGAGRRQGMRPRWDAVHAGRSWATLLKDRVESAEIISSEIEAALRMTQVPAGRPKTILNAPKDLYEEEPD